MIPRADNCADALTHPWGVADLYFWTAMGLYFIPLTPANPESHYGKRSLEHTLDDIHPIEVCQFD